MRIPLCTVGKFLIFQLTCFDSRQFCGLCRCDQDVDFHIADAFAHALLMLSAVRQCVVRFKDLWKPKGRIRSKFERAGRRPPETVEEGRPHKENWRGTSA